MSDTQDKQRSAQAPAAAEGIMTRAFIAADVVRFLVELVVYGLALCAAGTAFWGLWGLGAWYWRILAFPIAYAALIFGFCGALLLVRVVFVRRVRPGRFMLSERGARRWIVADSMMRMVERSFLRGYVKEFAPQRYVFYRAMGAKIDASFLIGWDVRILDPWLLEVGPNSLIGSFAVITGHAVEGNAVTLAPVRIGANVTIGLRAILMPGVEIGDGAVVGAGALVAKGKRIPPGEIWAGVPARKIGEADEAPGAS
jgi:acetyltransferase-like isoleucine patch superfamily enzyme